MNSQWCPELLCRFPLHAHGKHISAEFIKKENGSGRLNERSEMLRRDQAV
jgi:hypothetical protein